MKGLTYLTRTMARPASHVFALAALGCATFGYTAIAKPNSSLMPSILNVLFEDQETGIRVQNVFFAQTHVQELNTPGFKLVSNREALVKVHIVGPSSLGPPCVKLKLSLNGQEQEFTLTAPSVLPERFESRLGLVRHQFQDSYSTVIPPQWVQPGLSLELIVEEQSQELGRIPIGAPNALPLTMFDIHFFNFKDGDYPEGWSQELKSKLPISTLNLERVREVVFDELVIPPRAGVGPIKVDSPQSYTDQTGLNFDGEQGAAARWNRALQQASGRRARTRLYYSNIYNVRAGGQAGNFAGVGGARTLGILLHELGHALSLPHWANQNDYPYKGDMHGIAAPNSFRGVHAGPIWAYDADKAQFIPPTVQENTIAHPSVTRGIYKRDPMNGGGTGDQEQGFLMRHFSDFSVNRMQSYLENHLVVWNAQLQAYAAWDDQAGSYSRVVEAGGLGYPLVRDQQVLSVLASISGSAPEVNMVYPVIGPYKADLIRLLDPRVEADRIDAANGFCPDDGCDLTLRIQQNGVTKLVLLRAAWQPNLAVTNQQALQTSAINLPASDGPISKVELLLTPDAQQNGLPANPRVLDVWQ